MGYTTSALLAAVKLRTMLPPSQLTISDQQLIDLANDEMRSWLVPLMLAQRDNIFRAHSDTTLTSTRSYRVPKLAIGNNVWDITYIDATGLEQPMSYFEQAELTGDGGTALGAGYTIEGSHIVLNATAPTSGTMRVYYDRAPNDLALTTSAALQVITAVGAGTITAAGLSGVSAGTTLDLIKSYTPFDVQSGVVSSVAGSVYTIASGALADAEAFDYVSANNTTLVPNIPANLHPLLYQRLAAKVCEALGDQQGLQNAMSILKDIQGPLLNQLSQRVKAEPRPICSTELLWGY